MPGIEGLLCTSRSSIPREVATAGIEPAPSCQEHLGEPGKEQIQGIKDPSPRKSQLDFPTWKTGKEESYPTMPWSRYSSLG